jgi:hypothetical protein
MAGFQLARPAAEVSKISYGETRKSYQSPNAQYRVLEYNNFGVPHPEAIKGQYVLLLDVIRQNPGLDSFWMRTPAELLYCAFGL